MDLKKQVNKTKYLNIPFESPSQPQWSKGPECIGPESSLWPQHSEH